ncbi:MAG: hypothetical protein M1546_07575 [Chloroflexi bacterium]|nr:hypothetical protein [Chloroflexota bacterium]
MKPSTHQPQRRFERAIMIGGLLLALYGLLVALGVCCVTAIILFDGSSQSPAESAAWGLLVFTLLALTLGAGSVAFLNGSSALAGRPSRPLRLPSPYLLGGAVVFLIALSLPGRYNPLLAPVMASVVALLPLVAVAWFSAGGEEEGQAAPLLTWRRGWVGLAGGATVSVGLTVASLAAGAIVVAALAPESITSVVTGLRAFHDAVAVGYVAATITSRGFVFMLIGLALLLPVVSEFAKPLPLLPLLRRLEPRQVFGVGVVTGAGFAAVETVILVLAVLVVRQNVHTALSDALLVLVLRAAGSAIHPLTTGVVALGWREVLTQPVEGKPRWLACYAVAVGIQALWNAASLTAVGVIWTLQALPQMSAALLALLVLTAALLLPLPAWWAGRALPGRLAHGEVRFASSNRTVALWAVACLLVVAPTVVVVILQLAR